MLFLSDLNENSPCYGQIPALKTNLDFDSRRCIILSVNGLDLSELRGLGSGKGNPIFWDCVWNAFADGILALFSAGLASKKIESDLDEDITMGADCDLFWMEVDLASVGVFLACQPKSPTVHKESPSLDLLEETDSKSDLRPGDPPHIKKLGSKTVTSRKKATSPNLETSDIFVPHQEFEYYNSSIGTIRIITDPLGALSDTVEPFLFFISIHKNRQPLSLEDAILDLTISGPDEELTYTASKVSAKKLPKLLKLIPTEYRSTISNIRTSNPIPPSIQSGIFVSQLATPSAFHSSTHV